MAQVRKGFEDCFFSGVVDGKLVQGKLSDLPEATLQAIADNDPNQQMILAAKKAKVEPDLIKPEAPKSKA